MNGLSSVSFVALLGSTVTVGSHNLETPVKTRKSRQRLRTICWRGQFDDLFDLRVKLFEARQLGSEFVARSLMGM